MSSPGRRQPPHDPVEDELASDEDLAAYEAGLARLEARLKADHPELFDESGELRAELVTRLLTERAGGKTVLTGEEFSALIEPGFERRADAP
jgi:hypothetical protein